jgi:hypothetical protein
VAFSPAVDDVELYRQGALRAWRTQSGYVIHVTNTALARLNDDADVVDAVIAAPADARVYADLVGVLARALHGRLRGRFHIHAGLVVDERGVGTLVGGDGGAGKTTTTLALLQAGHALAGDDVAFLRQQGDDVVAEALPRALHVGATTLAMFPQLFPHVRGATTTSAGKQVVDVAPDEKTVGVDVPVGRLVFPCVTSTPTAARRLSPVDVFSRLLVASATATWPTLPGAQAHLDVLGRLLRVPAYAVDLGPDAIVEPGRIVRALGSLADTP